MVDDNTEVDFTVQEGGISVTVPAGRRGGSAPIALVFKLQEKEGYAARQQALPFLMVLRMKRLEPFFEIG